MIYAQIKDNKVVNTIVADQSTPLELFRDGFDYLLRIDNFNKQIGIGWSYDGESFLPPPPEEEEE